MPDYDIRPYADGDEDGLIRLYNQVFIALTRSNLFKKQKSGRFSLDEKAVAAERQVGNS